MTTFIEDIRDDIKNETDIKASDICIIFKRKYTYVKFYYSDGGESITNKFNKKELIDTLMHCEGSAHSVMRNHSFLEGLT